MEKFKIIGCVVALLAVVCANVWNATTVFKTSELDITNVESIAEGDVSGTEWNGFGSEKGSASRGCELWCVSITFSDLFSIDGRVDRITDADIQSYAYEHGEPIKSLTRYYYKEGTKIVCKGDTPPCHPMDCH